MRIFLFLLLSFWISISFSNEMHFIIDTDMGFDDWMAVLYLLKQPVKIDAITIDCVGETRCPQGAINAEKLTHLAKHDVPIAFGYIRPDTKYNFPVVIRNFATKMNIKDFAHLKKDSDIKNISAAQIILNSIVRAAKKHYQVSIISIGTATNITDAWKLAQKNHQEKLFREGLAMIYKGGGAFGEIKNNHLTNQDVPGNISIPGLIKSNNTVAEWNIYANAPAMKTLVNANLPITFIPNNASNEVRMTKKRYHELLKIGAKNRIDLFDANAMLSLVPNGNWKKFEGCDFWDTLATISALHPKIVTEKFQHVPIKIILKANNDYAATWVTNNSAHDVTVYYHVNKKMFYRFLFT